MRFSIYCTIAFNAATALNLAISEGDGNPPSTMGKDPLLDLLKSVEAGQGALMERCLKGDEKLGENRASEINEEWKAKVPEQKVQKKNAEKEAAARKAKKEQAAKV